MPNQPPPNTANRPGPKRFSSPPTLSLLLSPLFILSTLLLTLLILYNFAGPELTRLTGMDLDRLRHLRMEDLDLAKVDWAGLWKWVDPRQSFQRGQDIGVWLRREGPGWVRAVRERMEL